MDRNSLLVLLVAFFGLVSCGTSDSCGQESSLILTGNATAPLLACNWPEKQELEQAAEIARHYEILTVARDSDAIITRSRSFTRVSKIRGSIICHSYTGLTRWRIDEETVREPLHMISSVSISPSGAVLAVAASSQATRTGVGVFIFDTQFNRWTLQRQLESDLHGHAFAAWVSTDRYMYSETGRSFISLSSASEAALVSNQRVISVSPDRKRFLTLDANRRIGLRNVSDGTERCPGLFAGEAHPFATWSPSSRLVWISKKQGIPSLFPGTSVLWDIEACQQLAQRWLPAGGGNSGWGWIGREEFEALRDTVR
jgi:hypothetical protein